jgi:16S rRNA (cytosine967-C5)-methyltransferase
MPNAREIAYDLTRKVNSEGAFLSLLLKYGLEGSGLDSRDCSLVTELAYGLQRHRNKLDYIISNFSRRRLDKIEPEVLDLLRLGIYQISEMRVPAHASVNETVGLARKKLHQGAVSFINAVLRNVSDGLDKLIWPSKDDIAAYLETIYSHPRWIVDYLLENMDHDEAESLCIANNTFAGLTLRANPNKGSRESLLSFIENRGGRACSSLRLEEALIRVSVPRDVLIDLLNQGRCMVQDESSMVVAHVVHPSSDEIIVDACAAPGGKATHLAQLGGDTCRVIALDINSRRLEALKNMVKRLGLQNIEVREGDSTRLSEYTDILADTVLVDAPCSGLGTLLRKPELKWRRQKGDLSKLSEIQLSILEGCAGIVRSGGVLVYSVCTFTQEETTAVLKEFLSRNTGYRLENIAAHLPPALREWVGSEGFMQVMPHMHGMEGMFIARLVNVSP